MYLWQILCVFFNGLSSKTIYTLVECLVLLLKIIPIKFFLYLGIVMYTLKAFDA